MSEHEPSGLRGPEIVGAVGEEIRGAVQDGIVTGSWKLRRSFARWCVAAIILSQAGAAAIAWWIAAPRPATTSFVMHHSDGSSEVCDRTADSGPPHSVFVCRDSVTQ